MHEVPRFHLKHGWNEAKWIKQNYATNTSFTAQPIGEELVSCRLTRSAVQKAAQWPHGRSVDDHQARITSRDHAPD